MADDWIKVRVDLWDDPQVIGVAHALKLTIDVVVSKVLRAWSWAGRHTADGKIEYCSPAILDEAVDCSGLGEAMAAVGWLEVGDDSITFPRWDTHNSQCAKRRAQENRRKAAARAAERPQSVRSDADTTRRKCGPEKRREEQSEEKKKKATADAGSWEFALSSMDSDTLKTDRFEELWGAWAQHRREIGKPLKPTGTKHLLKALEGLGHERAIRAIKHSTSNGYQGVFEPGSRQPITRASGAVRAKPGKYDGR